MTRFARHGDGRKKPHDASKWSNLKKQNRDSPETSQKTTKKFDRVKKMRGGKDRNFKDRRFKGKNHLSNNKGSFVLKCYNCQKNGHKATDCTEPKQEDFKTICHFCKKDGHKAFSCPAKPEGMKENWKKAKRSEFRRQKRQSKVLSDKVCFKCRGTGHQLSECPKNKNDIEQGTGICFKCGSTEHSVHKCKAKVPPGEYPYAKCFICGETGHLSKMCPDNPRGLYPKGGCCNECGSVEHLKRDCPEFQERQGISDIKLQTIDTVTSLDSEDTPPEPIFQTDQRQKKKAKVVTF